MAPYVYMSPADPQAALKKKTVASRSWIFLDCTGEESVLDVDKYAIMHRVQIHARDLRILDPLLSYPSTILGREKAIVLNLEHIKAIITADEILLRDPLDDNVIPIVEELRRRLPLSNLVHQGQGDGKEHLIGQNDEAGEEDESPFEFRALEVALEAICSFLGARTTELETAAYPALDELTSKISSRNLDRVRKLKSSMTSLTARVQKVRDELEQLLNDDDDMAELYLSRKLTGSSSPVNVSGVLNWIPASPTIGSKISRASRASFATFRGDENDVEELEMLLEAYFTQIDGSLSKLTALCEYIDDTEDYINIQLDNHRNQLIQLELLLSSTIICLSFYSLVCAIFGMNIPYSWNTGHAYMFKWVRDELEHLLDDDDDMADLYLSRKLIGTSSRVSGSGAQNWIPESPTIASKISRASRASVTTFRGDENDVEELEMLLEAYFIQIDGTLNKLTTLREYIDDTEDYINIQLDNHRNQLIQLELFLSTATTCASVYALVAGIMGVNIPYTWNTHHGYMFKWVCIVTAIVCISLFALIISHARRKGLIGS